jgi:uncharacterized membrane protein
VRVILCVFALLMFGAGSAFADVTFCNKTTSKLQFAAAYPVTKPYVTKEIAGWHTIDAGDCTKVLLGNYTGDTVYYYIMYYDGSRDWVTKGEETVYPFCVRDQAFVRHGSYNTLQYDCPTGWVTRQFYGVVIQYADSTLNFYD